MISKHSLWLKRLVADRGGASAIELAVVLPVLLLLLFGTIDLSRMVAGRLDLEQAAQRTTDLALAVRPKSADGTYLQNEGMSAAGVPSSNVTVDVFLECDGTKQSDFNAICSTGQARARFVSVVIVKDVQPIFDWASLSEFLGLNLMPSSGLQVTGDSVVRFQ